jgi:glutathione reductase (NADPH)
MVKKEHDKFDLIVIGGGSGGVRTARIASLLGAKVALCEKDRMGGTCVIRGCIPKKLLFYSSQFKDNFKVSNSYGWSTKDISFNFVKMIKNKNIELKRLENIYEKNVLQSGVKIFRGEASFLSKDKILVNKQIIMGKKIIIASGGAPISLKVPGAEFAEDSDSIMQLKKLPKSLVIVGAGYIAIEFAFIFANLGTKVSLIVRKTILRGFDKDLSALIQNNLIKKNVKIFFNNQINEIKQNKNKLNIILKNKNLDIDAERVLVAIGRKPNIKSLGLNNIGIKLNNRGAIQVNKNLTTSIKNIYAIGDVTDRINLTPVAIAEGHSLSNKLFSSKNNKVDLSNIGTAVFSSPPICSIGLTESDALKKYSKLDVYESKFNSLKYSIVKKKVSTYIKLLVNNKNGLIIGAHMLGEEAPEIIQMIGVAINAKATFRNFIDTMAIHPTVAEEFVTFKEPSRKNY